MKLSETLKKFDAWRAERRIDREMRRAERPRDPAGVTIPQWLVDSAKAAGWIAMATLVYFLWIFTLDIAGDQSTPLHITHAGTWTGDISFFFPIIVGFVFIAVGVPFFAKIIIPIFISLDWRTNLWPKLWSLVLVLAFSFVVFAGTFSVQGKTIMEHGRGAAVAVAEVNQGRAAIQAQIDQETADLRDMSNNRNAYMAQAANVGVAAWQSGYIAQARTTHDERLPMIERALGAAQAADTRRAHITALRTQLAAAPVAESVQATVTTAGTSWIASTLDWLVGARAILLSLVMDVVCLLMPWIALRLEQTRNRQMGSEASGWADDAHRIEDHSDELPLDVDMAGMRPPKTVLRDADTKETIIDKDGYLASEVKTHTRRKKGKDGKPIRVVIPAEQLPDETGVTTGTGDERGASITMTTTDEPEVEQPREQQAADGVSEQSADAEAQPEVAPITHPSPSIPEPRTLTPEEINELFATPDPASELPGVNEEHHDEAAAERADDEGDEVADFHLPTPETLVDEDSDDGRAAEEMAADEPSRDPVADAHTTPPVSTALMPPEEAAAIRRRVFEEELEGVK